MPVTGETDEIIIDLSDGKNIHVTEFNRSYFELYFNIDIDMFQGRFRILPTNVLPEWLDGFAAWEDWTAVPAFVDIAKIIYFFIGFKNATDCIKYYRIQHNGREIGPTIKDKVQLESYLLNVMRPKSDKENKANSFTLWEDAHSHNVSVCGQYISMWDIYRTSLTGENALHVTFAVIIGFDYLLPFQNFGDFPSCVLGDFKLYIRVSPDPLVWCSVNPSESTKQRLRSIRLQKIQITKYLIINNIQIYYHQPDSK
jgi:hypothetical protein